MLAAALAGCVAPARIPAPLPRRGGPVVAERQDVVLSCDGVRPAPAQDPEDTYPPVVAARCSFASEVVVRNTQASAQRVEIELDARGAEAVVRDFDGRAVAVPESGDFRVTEAVALAPGETRALRARGRVYPAEGAWDRWSVGVLATRHPVLAWDSGPRHLAFELSPEVWASRLARPPAQLVVERPASWSLEIDGALPHAPPPRPTSAGLLRTEHLSQRTPLHGALLPPPSPIEPGGPVLGVGVVSGPDPPVRLDAALGYEFGAPEWLVGSILVDSDFHDRLVAALGLEVATPYFRSQSFPLPSLALGAGMPVRLLDEAAVGVRAQGAVCYPSIGVVFWIDWFPALDRADQALVLRFSL